MDPMVIERTLASKKNGDHTRLKSIKTSKNIFIIILKMTIFGADANNRVTLMIAPSYTSHNHA